MNEMKPEDKVTEQTETPEKAAPAAVAAPRKKAPAKKKATKRKATKKKGGKVLAAKTILSAPDIKEEEIQVPEWANEETGEDTVFVRGLSSIDHERLTQSCTEGPIGNRNFNMVGYQAKVAILCTYDALAKDGGKRIFQKDHLQVLMQKASGPIATIANKAHELSGIGTGAVDKFQENLGKTPNADSLFD
ncbi:MAG: hypothetical protein GY769_04410 [bacterium]|nr:hypothetical protein [bacterium]